jgi:DNA polymerase I-like protein with 3'-5' exonuclease and polymerase domains
MTLIEQFKAQTTVCKSILEKRFIGLNSQSYLFFNEVATNSLNWIEKSGLYVNPGGFLNVLGDKSKGLIHEGYVYSDYNLLTSTGRCSNRFGGINFAALPKKDGIREYFISRFGKDGELISVDYESFHLRLIAEMIVFDLPYLEPVHQYLGKQYFKTDTLTPEQYEAGKGITFQYLYGTYKPPEMKEIPYFVEVEKFTKALWKEMEIEGFVESPIFKKKIYLHHISDPNPSKVFNYLVQLFETEKNLFTLHKVGNEMRANKMESKIILYTYDAILIDAKISEMGQLSKVIGTLEHGGQYPVRVYRGENYQNLSLDEGKLRNI